MKARTVAIGELGTRAPFSALFSIEPAVRDRIVSDMRTRGYDAAEPIDVWDDGGGLVIVDGHTRLECARLVGIAEIPVAERDFANDLAALEYSLHKQRDRRNLKGAELAKAIMVVDETRRKPRGGDRGNQYTGGKKSIDFLPPTGDVVEEPVDPSTTIGDSHESRYATAAIVGTSPATVQRVRLIAADPVAKEALESGTSISAAANIAREHKRTAAAPKADKNGAHPAVADIRAEPWFAVRESGEMAKYSLIEAARDIRKELDKLAGVGLTVAPMMGDRRVSPGWNKALKHANEIAALLRATIRGTAHEAPGNDE